MMTKQEKKVQLDALAREIEGQEVALSNWKEDLEAAEGREDEDEVRRLSRNIRKSEKTIEAAKGQIALLEPDVKTRQEKAQTSESRPRGRGRAGAKAS